MDERDVRGSIFFSTGQGGAREKCLWTVWGRATANLNDVTLACEDANSKLVEVVTVPDVDSEDHVGNSLLQIWELTFGPKTKLFSDFEHKGWSRF